MKLVIIVLFAQMVPTTEAWSIAGAKNAVGAAKKFLNGSRKTKSAIQGTPVSQTLPGSVNTSGQSDGIVKKSVDFITNSAMAVVGIDTVYDKFFGGDEPVSFFFLQKIVFSFPFKAPTAAPAPVEKKHTVLQ